MLNKVLFLRDANFLQMLSPRVWDIFSTLGFGGLYANRRENQTGSNKKNRSSPSNFGFKYWRTYGAKHQLEM